MVAGDGATTGRVVAGGAGVGDRIEHVRLVEGLLGIDISRAKVVTLTIDAALAVATDVGFKIGGERDSAIGASSEGCVPPTGEGHAGEGKDFDAGDGGSYLSIGAALDWSSGLRRASLRSQGRDTDESCEQKISGVSHEATSKKDRVSLSGSDWSENGDLLLAGELADEHGDDAGGHEVGHGTGEHSAETEAGEVVATVGDEGSDAADLHADGAQVGEAAEGEGGDGEGARSERGFDLAKVGEGDELVDDGAGAEEVADDVAVVPGDADEPGDRRAHDAEDGVERVGKGDVAVRPEEVGDAEHDGVGEADESQEADEHDGYVEGERAAVDGAAGDGGDEVVVLVLFVRRHGDSAGGGGDFGLGHKHLRYEDGSGSGHDDGREEVLGVDAEADVGRHDAAGDVGHAGGHDGHELGVGGAGEEGADGERSFGLAHEDAGGDVGGLCAAGSHGALHDPGDDADDPLHEADVVEDGEEGRDEDDCGEDGEGEDGERVSGNTERAEDYGGAIDRMGEQGGDDNTGLVQEGLAVGPLNDEEGEDDLKAEAPEDGAPADGAAIGREGVREAKKGDEAEKTGETCQRIALLRW